MSNAGSISEFFGYNRATGVSSIARTGGYISSFNKQLNSPGAKKFKVKSLKRSSKHIALLIKNASEHLPKRLANENYDMYIKELLLMDEQEFNEFVNALQFARSLSVLESSETEFNPQY